MKERYHLVVQLMGGGGSGHSPSPATAACCEPARPLVGESPGAAPAASGPVCSLPAAGSYDSRLLSSYPQLATPRFYNAGYGDQAAAAADYANLAVDSSAFYPTLNPAYTMKEAADPWRGITQPASYYYDPALAAYGLTHLASSADPACLARLWRQLRRILRGGRRGGEDGRGRHLAPGSERARVACDELVHTRRHNGCSLHCDVSPVVARVSRDADGDKIAGWFLASHRWPAPLNGNPTRYAYRGFAFIRVRSTCPDHKTARLRARTASGMGGLDFNGARRKNVTRDSTSTLKAWLNEHRKNPYPTKGEKIMLAIITKMTLTQVSTWFANARRRLKKENKMTWEPRNKADADDSGAEDKKDDEDTMDERTASVQDPMRRSDSTRSYCSLSALQRSRESTLRPPHTSAEVDHEAAEMQTSHAHRTNAGSDLHQQRHNYGHSANPYALGGCVSVSNPQRHHVPGTAELAHGIHTSSILRQSVPGPPRPRISHVQVVPEHRGRLVGRRQRAQQAQDLVAG
ncbi:hypothetical protein MRX96_019032 [Rhipicephalus microplus]